MSEQAISIGKKAKLGGAKIAGVVSCLPAQQVKNDYFRSRFTENSIKDVVKIIGVQARHWVNETSTTKDLCRAAGERLLASLEWSPDSVDALIFVSQTPDYRLPATACSLQAELGLPIDSICFDVNLGCSGYPYGLWLGMQMIQTGAANRVLLAVGDTISKLVDPNDRSTALLFGDAGTITALEKDGNSEAFFIMGTDGRGAHNLIVPKGGFKDYSKEGDMRLADRKADCLYMDGGEIFNFTLQAVPALIGQTIAASGIERDDYDAFLLHQANLFMLKHLAKKAKLQPEKVPINIETYGNTSSASIPLLITTRIADQLRNKALQVGMFGFGVGYSWASASLRVGPLACVETISL